MAGGGDKSGNDFYGVLGLQKECSRLELRNAYKKLAMRWHPDRCSSSGNPKFVEEAKKKFQAIQEAYSVLSDETKRFLYDVGVYDNDDEQSNHGMGDFLNEMVTMMSETKPSENGEESFEQLQDLFEEMFQRENHEAFTSTSQGMNACSSPYNGSINGSCISNKRNNCEMNNGEESSSFNGHFQSFSVGAEYKADQRKEMGVREGIHGGGSSQGGIRRQGRKQKVAPGHDVASNEYTRIST